MANKQDEISRIIAARDAAHTALVEKCDAIQDRIQAIVDAARDRGFTPPEQTEITSLRSALDAATTADTNVQLVAVERLENSATIRGLIASLNAANKDLNTAFASVRSAVQTIKDIGDAIGKIDTLVAGLSSVLALIG